MKAEGGQSRLGAYAAPLMLDVVDGAGSRTGGKQIRAIVAVVRDGVDRGPRGARQPDRARPGLGIGKMDALALDPAPFKGEDFSEATSGQDQRSAR